MRPRLWAPVRTGLVGLSLSLAGPSLRAQAVCSAPHSSPVLASGGTIETLAPGAGWAQISLFRQRSDEFFGTGGELQPFLANGAVRTSSLYLTGAVGVIQGVDVWLQLPVHDVRYADEGGSRERSGVGDPRASLRVSPALFGVHGVPVAFRAGLKLPGSRFPVDATIIPLGEGQGDIELSLESGWAFGEVVPLYLLGWVGYRWRALNADIDRKPGDERFAHLAVGGAPGAFHLELAAEVLRGLPPRQLGVALSTGRRRLVQLQPTIGYQVGRGAVEATALLPLGGRNLPSGPGMSVGYRFNWGAP